MDIIFIFVVGFILLIMVIFSVVRMTTNRIFVPTDDLKNEITTLKNRIDELEKGENNK